MEGTTRDETVMMAKTFMSLAIIRLHNKKSVLLLLVIYYSKSVFSVLQASSKRDKKRICAMYSAPFPAKSWLCQKELFQALVLDYSLLPRVS